MRIPGGGVVGYAKVMELLKGVFYRRNYNRDSVLEKIDVA